MDMSRDTRSIVIVSSLRWVLSRTEPVDKLWPTFRELDILGDVVWYPVDFHLLESPLRGSCKLLTTLTKDSISALYRIHPDAIIMIAKGEV